MSSYISYDRMDKIQQKILESKEENKQTPSMYESISKYLYQYIETIESTLFFIAGSYLWYISVMKVLTWHKFPFHLYRSEFILILMLPILILAIVLYVILPKVPTKID